MRRVAVIGCGGSGKTTLARELGARLELPVLHIDGFYWHDDGGRRVESTPAEWRLTHRELIAGDRWIIDGMKLGVLPERIRAADTVVFLDLPRHVCLLGVLRRRLRFRGQHRPELGVYDLVNWQFIRWIWSFRRVHRPHILEALAAASCTVVVVASRADARGFLRSMSP